MAPAITHFLVGAAIALSVAAPLVLRYDIDREHAIWLVPLGGIWGLAPDAHHIAPIYAETLYAFHNSPWADVFGLHYTLDRPTVRARYYAGVFGAIVAFSLATGAFWSAGRIRRLGLTARRPLERAFGVAYATIVATGLATLALWVTVSVQGAFPSVAGLIGRSSTLIGGLVVIGCGALMGMLWGTILEWGLAESVSFDPRSTAIVGGVVGVGVWIVGVGVVLPLIFDRPVPFLHFGALGSLIAYGIGFGVVYGLVRGAFSSVESVPSSR